jgi:hypothetical protein
MREANAIAEDMLAWFGYHRTSRVVRGALDRGGRRSWDRAWARMRRMGDHSYDDYERRHAVIV